MLSRSTMVLGSLVLSVALAGCAVDPTTMARVPSNGPMPSALDERNGVVAVLEIVPDGYETSLRRVVGGAYVTLTPPIPDGHTGTIGFVRWLDGEALAGDYDGNAYRFRGGVWETLSFAACDATRPNAWIADAPAMDDVWIVATDPVAAGATLCHYDGAELTAETLDFVPQELVDVDGTLVAIDARVHRREAGSTTWSIVSGIADVGVSISQLVVRDDGAYAHFGPEDDYEHWWMIRGARGEHVDGAPGMGGERWRVEIDASTHTACHESWFDGHTYCSEVVDEQDYHVLRVDGAMPVEAGLLHLETPDVTWYVPRIAGPGVFMLAGSSGQIYVTVGD